MSANNNDENNSGDWKALVFQWIIVAAALVTIVAGVGTLLGLV